MHKPPLMILKSHDNARHIRELGDDFKAAKINIRAIGGGELDGVGVFAFAFDNDDTATFKKVKDIATKRKIDLVEWGGLTLELPDRPGALGDMARALEAKSINIGSLLVVGSHADSVILLVGIPEEQEKLAHDELVKAGFYVYDDTHSHATAAV
jgi:hypothetical protein